MSVWTHVAATFRLDDFRNIMGYNGPIKASTWDDIFGRECPYGVDANEDERYMPNGSEGSLIRSVWTDNDESSLFRHNVSIFGDLRDFNSYDDIERWFNESCKRVEKFGLSVRQAVCAVEVEFADPAQKVFLYDKRDESEATDGE